MPKRLSSTKKLLHLASFALSSLPVVFRQLFWRPQLVLLTAPTLACAPGVLILARLSGAVARLHIQDFEIDAAFGMGLLRKAWMSRIALWLERVLLSRFDRVSTISDRMLDRLASKDVDEQHRSQFPNWADIEGVHPLGRPSEFRKMLGLGMEYASWPFRRH